MVSNLSQTLFIHFVVCLVAMVGLYIIRLFGATPEYSTHAAGLDVRARCIDISLTSESLMRLIPFRDDRNNHSYKNNVIVILRYTIIF